MANVYIDASKSQKWNILLNDRALLIIGQKLAINVLTYWHPSAATHHILKNYWKTNHNKQNKAHTDSHNKAEW
jgi:spore germination protein GerM